jgi:hypothetical protein
MAVVYSVAVPIAVQELLHQGVEPVTLHDTELLDLPIDRVAIEAVTSHRLGDALKRFLNTPDPATSRTLPSPIG